MEEKLSSLIHEKGLTGGGQYWALLASSEDTYVVLEGILQDPSDLHNHEFQLLGFRSEMRRTIYCLQPWARQLIVKIDTMMKLRQKFLVAGDTSSSVYEIDQDAAARGLLIYLLVDDLPAEEFADHATSRIFTSAEEDSLRKLWDVLKPPSVLATTYQSPFASFIPGMNRFFFRLPSGLVTRAMSYTSEVIANDSIVNIEAEFRNLYNRRFSLEPVWSSAIRAADRYPVDEYARRQLDLEAGLRVRSYVPENEDLFSVCDLEVGGLQRLNSGGGAHRFEQLAAAIADAIQRTGVGAARAQGEPEGDIASIMKQAYAAFLPACAMSYPLFKDAPDHVKLAIYGSLAFITIVLHIGSLSKSKARGRLAIRLFSCSAVAAMTFSVASQLSGPTYVVVLTALAGVMVNLIIMFLRF